MKKNKLLILSTFCLTSLVGCGSKGGINDINKDVLPQGYQNSYTQEVTGQLHNKGMGWTALEEQTDLGKLDLGTAGSLPECDVIGIQTSWGLIEKTPNNFDWTLIDKTIDYWTARGKRINFRICTDSLSLPEVYFGAPSWINEAPYNVGYEEYVYSGNMMARVNDLTNKTYQELFERFMDKLAERYVNNPYLDTVDIRGYGMYGEWHSGHSFANMQERMDTLSYIIDEYQKRFAKNGIQLFLSCSWDYQGVNKDGSSASTYGNCSYDDYLDWSSIRHAMYLDNVGYRRDGLAGNGCTKYATDEKAISDQFRSGKKTSFSAEYFSGIANYENSSLGMNPMEATDELLFKSHCNYSTALGWVNIEASNILSGKWANVFDRGTSKMGYRFKVDRSTFPLNVSQGHIAHILTSISNSGVGRFTLENHNIRLMLINKKNQIAQTYDNKDYDLRILSNGEIMNVYSDFTIDSNLDNGEYTLAIAIVDELGNPDIRFGQVGDYDRMIYPLGKINIGSTEQLKDIAKAFSYSETKNHTLEANSHYELTFEYTPSLKLQDYLMGDDNGFEVRLVNNGKEITVANWQDVSCEKAIKTVTFATEDISNAHIEIVGTGVYEGKIEVGQMRLADETGYIQSFNQDYDLLSLKNVWYCDNSNSEIVKEGINNNASIVCMATTPHNDNECLFSDPKLLTIKPNTNYTISFDTKGYSVGGNGAYYYVKLVSESNSKMIGEWYDRPDEPQRNITYNFTTGDETGYRLVFGVNNVGAYTLDNINIHENHSGTYIKGKDHGNERNAVVYDSKKQSDTYVEGFEDGICNDAKYTYGFNRWGGLTNDPDQVISGKLSFTSHVDPMTYSTFFDNNWFEFFYSNPKYTHFIGGTKYKITFKYKILDKIVMNTDPESSGYIYMLMRSVSGKGDSQAINFGSTVTPGQVKNMTTYITTPEGIDDCRFIMGVFGRGEIIVDDILITKA